MVSAIHPETLADLLKFVTRRVPAVATPPGPHSPDWTEPKGPEIPVNPVVHKTVRNLNANNRASQQDITEIVS